MASNFTKNVISAIDIKNVKYNIKAIPFHATEAEWNSISYIPKQGEFIVYDVDNNNTSPRFKTGDGVTDVKILPFTLATISEVQTYVNSQIGSAGHLKRIILEEGAELPDISEADADTIYMKRNNESRLVSDVFDEYMAINGAWEIIGNTKVDLSNYVTQEQLNEEITEWVGDTVVSEQISTAIRSHNISSVAHSSIREKALCVQELPYLISGTVNDLRIHPSIIYGNGKYISIDAALWNIRTSIDGINWETSVTVPVMGSYHAGIYGNGKYVFISMNNELGYPIALYSEDAINWNYNKIEFTFNGEVISPEVWDKIVFENGIFILSGSAPVIIYSEDAISWTCSNEFLYNGSQLRPHTICYGNDKYVAFSNSTVSNILPVFTSTDAITWTANEIDLSLLSQEILEVLYPAPPTNFNYNMTYANNTFVAIFGHKVTATSTDGVNWNFAANLPYLGVWRNITYKNGTFVTVADNNELRKSIAAYSTDGTTWNIADKFGNPLKVEWLHLISGEDKFLITSENGQLAYSSDGINWTYAIKSVATLFSEEKTSDLKEVLGVGDSIYVAEESTDTSAEVINADTLGGYSASDFRHSDWLPTAEEIGAASMDYAKKVGNPYNLLDNSDFRNPVNQRGCVSGTVGSANYTIDRWKLEYDTYLHLHSGYVGMSGFWGLSQLVGCKMFAGKTYTFSVEAKSEAANGNMFMRLGDPTGTGAKEYRQAVNSNIWSKCVWTWTADRDYEPGECLFSFGINTGNELTTQIYYKKPAVYEGEYTAETLPEYQPKGYGAELAECQRYFYAISGSAYSKAGFGQSEGNNVVYPMVIVPVPMRVRPTVTYSGNWKLWDGSTEIAITSVATNGGATSANNCSQVSLTVNAASAITAGKMYTLTVRNDAAAYLWLSADL